MFLKVNTTLHYIFQSENTIKKHKRTTIRKYKLMQKNVHLKIIQ